MLCRFFFAKEFFIDVNWGKWSLVSVNVDKEHGRLPLFLHLKAGQNQEIFLVGLLEEIRFPNLKQILKNEWNRRYFIKYYKISSQNPQNLNRTRKHPLLKGVAGPFSTGLGILIA